VIGIFNFNFINSLWQLLCGYTCAQLRRNIALKVEEEWCSMWVKS
jgi:hypothetical protein